MIQRGNRTRSATHRLLSAALIAVLTAALWYGWFAWDTEYDVDPATGSASGPYEVWQGVGAFVCSLPVFWLAHRLLHIGIALVVMPIAFTAAWISTASSMDDSGLWLVGAVFLAVGSTMGSAMMLGLTAAVRAGLGRNGRVPSGGRTSPGAHPQ